MACDSSEAKQRNMTRSREKSWDPQNADTQRGHFDERTNRAKTRSIYEATHRRVDPHFRCCEKVKMGEAAMPVGIFATSCQISVSRSLGQPWSSLSNLALLELNQNVIRTERISGGAGCQRGPRTPCQQHVDWSRDLDIERDEDFSEL